MKPPHTISTPGEAKIIFDNLTKSKVSSLRARYALTCIFLSVTFLVVAATNDDFHLVPWLSAIILGICGAYIENSREHFLAASLMLFIASSLLVFISTVSMGSQYGILFYYLVTCSFSIIFIGKDHPLLRLVVIVLTIVLVSLTYILTRSSTPFNQMIFIINIIFSISLVSYVIWYTSNSTRNTESQLIEGYVKLSRMNRELDSFAYCASHEMRAPLAAIAGLIDITEKSNSMTDVKTYLDMMRRKIAVMNIFIGEITGYSRNERTDVYQEEVNIAEVVHSILDNLSYVPGKERIKFSVSIPSNLRLVTDRQRLTMIISNLLTNAIRYSDTSKHESLVDIDSNLEGGMVIIKVSDNGIGISNEHLNRIFDMFYRAPTNKDGSGLGLYIVSEACKKIGASISVSSKLGARTTFTIHIPVLGV